MQNLYVYRQASSVLIHPAAPQQTKTFCIFNVLLTLLNPAMIL